MKTDLVNMNVSGLYPALCSHLNLMDSSQNLFIFGMEMFICIVLAHTISSSEKDLICL